MICRDMLRHVKTCRDISQPVENCWDLLRLAKQRIVETLELKFWLAVYKLVTYQGLLRRVYSRCKLSRLDKTCRDLSRLAKQIIEKKYYKFWLLVYNLWTNGGLLRPVYILQNVVTHWHSSRLVKTCQDLSRLAKQIITKTLELKFWLPVYEVVTYRDLSRTFQHVYGLGQFRVFIVETCLRENYIYSNFDLLNKNSFQNHCATIIVCV
jgi:hypothetical protein